jgi:hypothetical protein
MAISAEEPFFTYQTLPPSPTPRPAVVKFCIAPEVRIKSVFTLAGTRAVVPATWTEGGVAT